MSVGRPATFTVAASGTAPLRYQWQRNGANIAGATAPAYTLAVRRPGRQRRALPRASSRTASARATSNEAMLTVTVEPARPTATIIAARRRHALQRRTVDHLRGHGDRPRGRHAARAAPSRGRSTSTTTRTRTRSSRRRPARRAAPSRFPTTGETSANVWYRIHLTVRDSAGLTATTFRDVLPRTVQVTLATSPAGLPLTLDGQPWSPRSRSPAWSACSARRAPRPQSAGGKTYDFVSWSDGGARRTRSARRRATRRLLPSTSDTEGRAERAPTSEPDCPIGCSVQARRPD